MRIISILLVVALSSLANSIESTSFPSELLGKWSPEIENCAAEFSYFDPESKYSATRNMVISEKRVTFWESSGNLISIIKSGNNYVANLEMFEEDLNWTENQTFVLSNGGDTLSRVSKGFESNYHRCKK